MKQEILNVIEIIYSIQVALNSNEAVSINNALDSVIFTLEQITNNME